MADQPLQIIDADGKITNHDEFWIPDHAELESDEITIVAVLGAQASGKSTLLNEVFGTTFPVGSRATLGSATTKGVAVAKAVSNKAVVALDIEGSDSRERGKEGKAFHAKCASFATALADVILLNVWYHDIGRLDSTVYHLLESVFSESEKAADADAFATSLVFVVRDVELDIDVTALENLVKKDASDIWNKTFPSSHLALDDLFDVSVSVLPHMRHCPAEFKEGCADLSAQLLDKDAVDSLARTDYSKGVTADSFSAFAANLWETQFGPGPSIGDRGGSGDKGELTGAFQCNEAFSDVLNKSLARIEALSEGQNEGTKIDGYGAKCGEIMTSALEQYDDATEEHLDEPIQSRKRRELESIIDTSQHAVYMKQIQLLRENAMTHFKSATSSEDMPSDFAFFSADALFLREVEESKRPGASWSSEQERTDLQNMMQEISTQRKKLLTSQVSAAQQQAHAMQYLQIQQGQMNAIQAQAYGGGGPGQWNVGAAYRPPDTNINASLSYQQGRTNIQISMIPDESASLLGPNGFSGGVGPGNLGLSFNIGYVSIPSFVTAILSSLVLFSNLLFLFCVFIQTLIFAMTLGHHSLHVFKITLNIFSDVLDLVLHALP